MGGEGVFSLKRKRDSSVAAVAIPDSFSGKGKKTDEEIREEEKRRVLEEKEKQKLGADNDGGTGGNRDGKGDDEDPPAKRRKFEAVKIPDSFKNEKKSLAE